MSSTDKSCDILQKWVTEKSRKMIKIQTKKRENNVVMKIKQNINGALEQRADGDCNVC